MKQDTDLAAKIYLRNGLDIVIEKLEQDIDQNSSSCNVSNDIVSSSSISPINQNMNNFASDVNNSINTNKFHVNINQLLDRFSHNNSFNSSENGIEIQESNENRGNTFQFECPNRIWRKNSVNSKFIYETVKACQTQINEFITKQNNIYKAQKRINTQNKERIKNIEEVLGINRVNKNFLNKKTKRNTKSEK